MVRLHGIHTPACTFYTREQEGRLDSRLRTPPNEHSLPPRQRRALRRAVGKHAAPAPALRLVWNRFAIGSVKLHAENSYPHLSNHIG